MVLLSLGDADGRYIFMGSVAGSVGCYLMCEGKQLRTSCFPLAVQQGYAEKQHSQAFRAWRRTFKGNPMFFMLRLHSYQVVILDLPGMHFKKPHKSSVSHILAGSLFPSLQLTTIPVEAEGDMIS